MSISLYEVSIESYLQALGGLVSVLEVARTHCTEKGVEPDSLLEQRLIDGMLPLTFQLNSARHHSRGAIEGLEKGLFQPPPELPAMSFGDFQQFVADTIDYLKALDAEQVNALESKSLLFKAGEFELNFTARNFLLSFSLPNFYFHVTTAYDILRKAGVPLSKINYLGQMRFDR